MHGHVHKDDLLLAFLCLCACLNLFSYVKQRILINDLLTVFILYRGAFFCSAACFYKCQGGHMK